MYVIEGACVRVCALGSTPLLLWYLDLITHILCASFFLSFSFTFPSPFLHTYARTRTHMAIKKLFSKINNHRSSKTGITTTHHRDNEKCEIVPSHPSSLTDAASTPDMRNKKKKSSSTKKWRKKFSLPSGSSWTTYANNNNSSNTPRRRNSLVAFTPSGSLPCFRAGSTTDPTTVTTSSASFADHDYNDVDELPLPQRPFSCSTVIMPDILHALRSNDKDPHEDNYNEHEEQLMTVDESSSFASRYCIASSSKFQQSSICSAVGQHVVSPSMHAAPSCSSAPASSIDSKTAAPTTTTSTPPETCYKSVTHNEKIELTPPFLPSSPPPSTTDLAAIASVDHHSSSQQGNCLFYVLNVWEAVCEPPKCTSPVILTKINTRVSHVS